MRVSHSFYLTKIIQLTKKYNNKINKFEHLTNKKNVNAVYIHLTTVRLILGLPYYQMSGTLYLNLYNVTKCIAICII